MKKNDRLSGYFDVIKETMSSQEFQLYCDENVKKIVQHAYQNAPKFKKRMDKVGLLPGDIQNSGDLRKVPVLKKEELMKCQVEDPPFGGFLAQPVELVKRIYISPGPIYDPHSESVVRTMTQVFYNCGFRRGDIVLNTWSYHFVPAGCLLDDAFSSLGAIVIPAGVGQTELQVINMNKLEVTAFTGTTGFLMAIIKKAEAMGYDFKRDFFLEVALVGGEMGGGPMRDVFESKYGLITSDAYGTADVGLLAYECRERTGMHFVTDAFVEIVDPESGERLGPGDVGEIVATPYNFVYPLIRFGTGDLASYSEEPCLCGRTTPKIEKIIGRIGEAIRIRGLFLHRNQLDQVFKHFPEVTKYQVTVDREDHRDKLSVLVEVNKHDLDKSGIGRKLTKRMQEICTMRPDEIFVVAKGSLSEGYSVLQDLRVY